MCYKVIISEEAGRFLKKTDKHVAKMIEGWIDKNLVGCDDPFAKGKPLVANKSGLWRYRVQDWRIVCKIDDGVLVIIIIKIGHRRDVYED